MTYGKWETEVPQAIKGDSVWKSKAYRMALFLADLCWHDATKLLKDRRTMSLSDQLFRSAGGISANIEEGYSRGTGKDRARFYEYGLGSARESRGWYYKGRHVLGEKVSLHRISLIEEVIKLLITMIPDQRGQILSEEPVSYRINTEGFPGTSELLTLIPMP